MAVVPLGVARRAERVLVGPQHRVAGLRRCRGCCGTRRSRDRRSGCACSTRTSSRTPCGRCRRRWRWHPPRRRRTVVAVAVVAGRRREIVALRPSPYGARSFCTCRADRSAAAPSGALVALHALGVGVALRAGGRDVQRVDGRLRVGDEPHAVRAVAADAGRHLGVALGELLSVHAGRVLGRLIDALLRRVLAHQRRVAVASRAHRDDLRAGRLATGIPWTAPWRRPCRWPRGSPPWQSTQLKPRSRWTSVSAKSRAGVASVALTVSSHDTSGSR